MIVAVPATIGAVPIGVPSSVMVTDPVGFPAAAVTVAMTVTGVPTSAGFGDAVTVVVVAAMSTAWAWDPELGANVVDPAYSATIEWGPTDRSETVTVTVPPLRVPVPIGAASAVKVTVPVGAPDPEVTVAVKVTATPNADGFALDATAVVVAAGFTIWSRTPLGLAR